MVARYTRETFWCACLTDIGACDNRGDVLPATQHAAEEQRTQGVASGGGVAPTGTANDTLQANDDTISSIRKLHRDAMTVRGSSSPATSSSHSLFLGSPIPAT